MSVKVMTYVWDYSQQTGTHLLMMLAIADHANDAGECFPMVKRLAAKCRVSVRQAQYLIKALEDAGELLIERGTGRGNPSIYTVKGATDFTLYRKGAADCTLDAERVQPIAPIKKRKGAIQRQKRVQSSAPALKNARGVLREPSLEPSEEQEKEKDISASTASSSDDDADIVDARAFFDLFNANVPDSIPKVTTLSAARKNKITQYLKQFPDRHFWLTCFRAPQASAFLRGERHRPGHEGFKFTLDWLLTTGKDGTENCVKVYEGRYADTQGAHTTSQGLSETFFTMLDEQGIDYERG